MRPPEHSRKEKIWYCIHVVAFLSQEQSLGHSFVDQTNVYLNFLKRNKKPQMHFRKWWIPSKQREYCLARVTLLCLSNLVSQKQ
ncbi:hypothetical protein Pelo_14751 [Pelomyxa schiedti]|nr:hypothetical protein Pelo_14751 [Pelomyxa schiedti]